MHTLHTCTRNPTCRESAPRAPHAPRPKQSSARALKPGGLALIDTQSYTTLPELKQLVADAGLTLLGIYGDDEDMRAFTGGRDNGYTIIAERV
jgi:hypothetical protein